MKERLLVILIFLSIFACSLNKGKSSGFIYIVKKGDSLTKISQEYKVSISDIKYYNDKYYNDLIIGEKLFIPLPNHDLSKKETIIVDNESVEKNYKTSKVHDGLIYRVQAGDNLYRISRNFGLTISQIKELNNLTSDLISIDQKLYIKKYETKKEQKSDLAKAKESNKLAKKDTKTESPSKYSSPNAGDAKTFPQEWKSAFILPVSGRLSSPFGMRGGRLHKGVDISAPPGSQIKAAFSGRVSYTGFMKDYGNIILIEHGNDVVTVYAHNEINLVKKSDTVNKGDVIARLGSTGRSTGPHLHFEIRVANKPIDPAEIIREIKSLEKI